MDTFNAKVEKGKLVFEAPIRVANHLNLLNGQKVEVVIRKLRSQRSNNQNNYYWGIIIESLYHYLEDTGHTREEIHEICKFKFLRKYSEDDFEFVRSTASLNTTEFEKYLEDVRRWSALLGCYIPNPNEQ